MQAVIPPGDMRPWITSKPASRVTAPRPRLSTTDWMAFNICSEVLALTAASA